MSALQVWLASAPQGAVALITAVLAASVAIVVTFLTQWILGRRARTDLLTKKLEELYLALNEVSAHNFNRVEVALPLAVATPFAKPKIEGSSMERQGLDLHKKIVMLVSLYFPGLSRAHQEIFRRNSAVNTLIYEAEVGPALSAKKLIFLAGAFRDAAVAMEEEIICNRRVLVKDYLWPTRYKHVHPVQTTPPTD